MFKVPCVIWRFHSIVDKADSFLHICLSVLYFGEFILLATAQLLYNWYEHHPSKQNDLDSSVIGMYEEYIMWGGATFDFCFVLLYVIVLWLHFNWMFYIIKW